MTITLDTLKSFEHNTSVGTILQYYFSETDTNTMLNTLICETSDLIEYWSEQNNLDPASIIDAIESNLDKTANFTLCENDQEHLYFSTLTLPGHIGINLSWNI